MKNSKWNKYEAALLIDGYKRVANGHASIKEVAMRISERIRPSNLQDCETYRNVNGITLQLGAIQFLMTDGAHGISHVSNLFREIVKLYKEDPTEFARLLDEARQSYPNKMF